MCTTRGGHKRDELIISILLICSVFIQKRDLFQDDNCFVNKDPSVMDHKQYGLGHIITASW